MLRNIVSSMHTKNGKIIISIILGLGFASIFRKVCNDTNCLDFKGPDLDELKDKVFQHNENCYKFTPHSVTCNAEHKQVHI